MNGRPRPDATETATAARLTTTATTLGEDRHAAERERQHQDELLDEALQESFPASDPPASWAGA